jgi:cell division septation protein DedD
MRSIIVALTIIGIVAFLPGPGRGANEEDWVEKGLKLISKQQYDEAIKAFSTAIEIIPLDYQAYNYRGVARALKGDFDRAMADYNKALKIRPRYAEAYNNLGFARTQMGDLKQALNDYSRALEINPFFVDAYNNKAWILATAADKRYRNGAKAIMLAQKAVELKPSAASLDTLAAAYAAAGNFESAIDTQKKAVQKLLVADQTSEVPGYMAHLNTYRSQQSLRIDYAAVRKHPKTDNLKISLKTKPKDKPVHASKEEKIVTPPQTKKAVAAAETKKKVSLKTKTKDKPAHAAKEEKIVTPPQTKKAVAAAETQKIEILPLPATKPLPYTIQVSAFRDLQMSNQVATKLLTNGDRAFTSPVQVPGKGKWHRVYIGYYKTQEEAKVAAAGLKKRSFRYVRIAKKPYAVQVGLVSSEKEVLELKSRLQAKGYLAYSLPAGNEQRQTRILIGAYESKEAAVNLTNQLRKDGFSAEILPR